MNEAAWMRAGALYLPVALAMVAGALESGGLGDLWLVC